MKERNLIIAAIAGIIGILLVGCSNEEYLGEVTPTTSLGQITFNSSVPKLTRTDAATAGKLGNNFVVWGTKTLANKEIQKVFDNYQVNYVTNTAGTTTTNSADWEYINYKNVPDGVTSNVGVQAFSVSDDNTGGEQTIKYWDFSALQYDFFAYSLGEGGDEDSNPSTANTYATTSAMNSDGYSLTGNLEQLKACFISKKRTISSLSASATQVNLEFISFLSRIQMKFYETIPGYSVKELRFYVDDAYNTTSNEIPTLYAGNVGLAIATGGTYNIRFDANGNPLISSGTTGNTTPYVTFEEDLIDYAGPEFREANDNYIGRTSNAATATEPLYVVPNATGAVLTLKMDYTLVSRDRTYETIQVRGATATIPAAFTTWQPGYAYTYIFKLTDDNLTPITLDAVVNEDPSGYQETITTVNLPSITTYAKGQVTEHYEYNTGQKIYVVVENAKVLITSGEGTNARLYIATTSDAGTAITEASVANALANGTKDNETTPTTWTQEALTVTTNGVPTLEKVIKIDAEDAPEGKDVTINGAAFTPTTAGTYVFEYTAAAVYYTADDQAVIDHIKNKGDIKTPETKHYKIIKVKAAP